MAGKKLIFVKKNRILMCRFEDCWDSSCSTIAKNTNFIANIRPEIGKDRPVIVVYAHKRTQLALIIPFTTQKPTVETQNTLKIPIGIMPGVLSKKECWALCDMIQTVSINRLHYIYSGTKDVYRRRLDSNQAFLPEKYFVKLIEIIKNIFNQ